MGRLIPVTGMVADIGALDRMVQEKVVKVFDRAGSAPMSSMLSPSRAGNSPNGYGHRSHPVSFIGTSGECSPSPIPRSRRLIMPV